MRAETTKDRLHYFDDFASEVTKATGATFNAIYDFEDDERTMDGEVQIVSGQPMLTCRTSDISGLTRGDELQVEGITYTVRYRNDDGSGTSTIYLQS